MAEQTESKKSKRVLLIVSFGDAANTQVTVEMEYKGMQDGREFYKGVLPIGKAIRVEAEVVIEDPEHGKIKRGA